MTIEKPSQLGRRSHMLTFMRMLTVTILLTIASQAGADVYTWVDETGQVHYSDSWVVGCEKVEIPDFPSPDAPAVRVVPPTSALSGSTEKDDATVQDEPEKPEYKSLTVVSPAEGECLRRIGGIVKILLDVDPAPQKGKLLQKPGHRLVVSVDGKVPDAEFLIGVQDGSLALFLTAVYRGTHRLQVRIEDMDGQSLAQSPVVNFHIQQFSPIIREQQLREQRQPPNSSPSP